MLLPEGCSKHSFLFILRSLEALVLGPTGHMDSCHADSFQGLSSYTHFPLIKAWSKLLTTREKQLRVQLCDLALRQPFSRETKY